MRTKARSGESSPLPVPTLAENSHPRALRRARDARRAGLALLGLLVVAGLSGMLGVTSATATRSADGYSLTVTYPRVTRAGVAAPFHVSVAHPGGFPGPIRLAVSEGLFERFDFQNFYPNPDSETATPTAVHYEFAAPPGAAFHLDLDARTAPDQNGSTSVYRVSLMVAGRPAVVVPFRMWVAP